MMLSFHCPCGNTDPTKSHFYDGSLGYEAVICTECGRFSDEAGLHEADDWSQGFVSESDAVSGAADLHSNDSHEAS